METRTDRTAIDDRLYGGLPRSERQNSRRLRLIGAAIGIYADSGYRGARIKEICESAGLTNRYFYESFSGLEELFLACHAHVVEGLFTYLEEKGRTPEPLAPTGRHALLHAYFSELRAEPKLARVFLADIRGISQALDRQADDALRRFADLLFDGSRSRDASAEYRSLVTMALASAVVWISKTWIATDFAVPIDTVVDAAVSLLPARVPAQRLL
jgi:AcrR family transcriptional regulator